MRIALATCERPIERDVDFDFLAPALRRRGAEVEGPTWSDPSVQWSGFDLVVPSSTWDYNERPEEFRRWLRAVDAAGRLRNPLATIEWNLDKRYLRELTDAGIPAIPTVWTEPGDEQDAAAEAAANGWDEVIVKPVIDLGARRLARVGPEMVAEILRRLDEPAMVQPYLPSVQTRGELSLLFFEGRPAYAVRRMPTRGDFRVQAQYGGTHEAAVAPAQALRIGLAALEAAPGDPLYARVDLVSANDGSLRLIELELIAPALFVDSSPRSAELIARALLAAVNEPRSRRAG